MLSIQAILEGVKTALTEEFPGVTLYVNYAPRGFSRPACLVECGPVKQDEIGGSFVKFDVEVKVTCFEPVDSYGNSDTGALIDMMCTVMALFSGGYIRIGGRAPHVTALWGDYQLDFAEVKATLSYTEQWPDGAPYPLMGEVHTKLKEA